MGQAILNQFHRSARFRSSGLLFRLATSLTMVLSTSSGLAADPLPEAKYLPEKAVAVATLRVGQLYNWKPVQLAKELGMFDEADFGPLPFTVEDVGKIDRVVVAIDQPFVNELATDFGLKVMAVGPAGAKAQPRVDPANNLKQIGLSMHNYHDTYSMFPRANGDGGGRQTGLSWRVHLLPFLDEGDLYSQFHLDEPWDSVHNKKLIPKMPKFFAVEGVKAAGKTSIHLITGPKTMFPEDAKLGPSLRDITDGTSNTILAVQADPATAVEWTKPGGLPFDSKNPKGLLGRIPDSGVLVLLCDGAAKKMPSKVTEEDFASYVTPAGGEPANSEALRDLPFRSPVSPTVVVSFKEPFDLARLEPLIEEKITVGRHTIYCVNGVGIWPATPFSPTTLVIASVADLEAKLKAGTISSGKQTILGDQLDLKADFSMVISLQAQKLLLKQLVEDRTELESLLDYQVLTQHVQITDLKKGDLIIQSSGTCTSAKVAGTRADELKQQMQLVKALLPAMLDQIPNPDSRKLMSDLAAGLKVEQVGNKITTSLVAPAGVEKLPDYFEPALRDALAAANATKQRNNLKQIGLAFHNSHDVFGRFPSSSRTTNPDDSKALSWRVHILPLLDQGPLYNQFHLNEPWDSPHNLKLAEQMPAVYKTPGVQEANKTSMHLIAGEGTPFDKEKAPHVRDFKDGLSNTLMVIIAGPDKAEIWTKPGGLPIDPKEPVKSLGNIGEKGTNALNGDGSIRKIDADIARETLLNLVRHNDGN
ncbi:MAG: hypothetical protein C0478_03315 [Planctomyces sp.]|nr:hypothetical protein [Planctomyces sp.]